MTAPPCICSWAVHIFLLCRLKINNVTDFQNICLFSGLIALLRTDMIIILLSRYVVPPVDMTNCKAVCWRYDYAQVACGLFRVWLYSRGRRSVEGMIILQWQEVYWRYGYTPVAGGLLKVWLYSSGRWSVEGMIILQWQWSVEGMIKQWEYIFRKL